MKNNTNQIMKLNIPIWIKYWLSKHKNASYILSEILTGTEFFLQDSAPKKFKIFDIIGRTTQESTTGKNIINKNSSYFRTNVSEYITKEETETGIQISSSYPGTGMPAISFKTNINMANYIGKKIRIQGNLSNDKLGFRIIGINNEDNTKILAIGESGESSLEYTIATEEVGEHTTLGFTLTISGQTLTGTFQWNDLIMTIDNPDMTYEPYTGGEPAPNPNYPFPIKNTGDNGTVNEKVENKNLLNPETCIQAYIDNNYNIIVNNNNILTDYIKVEKNKPFSSSLAKSIASGGYVFYDNGKNPISRSESIPVFNGKTFETDGYIRMWFNPSSRAITIADFISEYKPQVEQGSTATSYVPHAEQNPSFPLAQGQKLYEGEELKENGKDDIWGEKILDGTEDWQYVNGQFVIYGTNYLKYSDGGKCYSSHFIGSAIDNLINVNLHMWIGNNTFILCQYDDITSLEDWKTFLAEQYANGTPVTLVYKKAEPTITPYTEGQQQYYDEHIKPLRTHKNVTHISSEDETPALLKIQYWKEG